MLWRSVNSTGSGTTPISGNVCPPIIAFQGFKCTVCPKSILWASLPKVTHLIEFLQWVMSQYCSILGLALNWRWPLGPVCSKECDFFFFFLLLYSQLAKMVLAESILKICKNRRLFNWFHVCKPIFSLHINRENVPEELFNDWSFKEIKQLLSPPIWIFSIADQDGNFNWRCYLCCFFCLQNRLLLSWKCSTGLRTVCHLVVLKNKALN